MTTTAKPWMPRIARVDALDPAGCLFHVGSPAENFRVTRLGGEQEYLRRLLDTLRPDDVLYDIGACIGLVSVHARRRGAAVVAFEPEPTFRGRLKENLALNGIDDVRVVDWAVADREGEITLYTDGQHGTSPSLSRTEGRGTMRVRTATLDGAIGRGELPPPTVVKMDIEGAEVRALRGMTALLSLPGRPRAVFLEVHPPMLADLGDGPADVTAILSDSGYRLADEGDREQQMLQVWVAA